MPPRLRGQVLPAPRLQAFWASFRCRRHVQRAVRKGICPCGHFVMLIFALNSNCKKAWRSSLRCSCIFPIYMAFEAYKTAQANSSAARAGSARFGQDVWLAGIAAAGVCNTNVAGTAPVQIDPQAQQYQRAGQCPGWGDCSARPWSCVSAAQFQPDAHRSSLAVVLMDLALDRLQADESAGIRGMTWHITREPSCPCVRCGPRADGSCLLITLAYSCFCT